MRDTDTHRERQRHRKKEKKEKQAPRREPDVGGTRPRVSRITPWAEGGAKLLSHHGCPIVCLLNFAYSRISSD